MKPHRVMWVIEVKRYEREGFYPVATWMQRQQAREDAVAWRLHAPAVRICQYRPLDGWGFR